MKNQSSLASLEKEINRLQVENEVLRKKLVESIPAEKSALLNNEELSATFQANFRTFFNTVGDFLFVIDKNGNMLEVNQAVYRRLGYSKEELQGQSVLMIHPQDRRLEVQQVVARMMLGTLERCLIPLTTKSGQNISVETTVKAGVWNGQSVIFGVSKDLSQIALSEEKFSKAFNNSLVMSSISEIQTGVYLEVNDTYCRTLGYTRSEMVGKSSSELNVITFENRRKILNESDLSQGIRNIEIKLRKKNGEMLSVLLSIELIFVQDKPYMYATAVDISEQKRVQMALLASEKKLRTIFDIIGVGIAVTDENGAILECNKSCEQILGISSESLLGNPFIGKEMQVVDLDFKPKPIEEYVSIKALREHQAVQNVEIGIINPQGSVVWVNVSAEPLYLPGYGVIISYIDITARLEAQRAHKESEMRLKLAIEAANEGTWDWNVKTGGVIFNSKWAEILGYDLDEIEKNLSTWKKLIHPEDLYGVMTILENHLKGETEIYKAEYRFQTKTGDWKWVEDVGKVIEKDAEGNPLRVIGLYYDISDQKNIQQQLLELNATKDKFFSIIAHDLKNPFGAIIGFSTLIDEECSGKGFETLKEYNHYVLQSAQIGYELLVNLLDWSRLQSGRIKFNPEVFDLHDCTWGFATLFAASLKEKQLDLEVRIPSLFQITADRLMIETILRNLISNAIKFTPKGGKIVLEAVKEGAFIKILVMDSGVGMSSEMVEKLFKIEESFSTAGTNNEQGTGLGLVLCKDFVKQHRGHISVKSVLNEGSTFVIKLPERI